MLAALSFRGHNPNPKVSGVWGVFILLGFLHHLGDLGKRFPQRGPDDLVTFAAYCISWLIKWSLFSGSDDSV